ncbi:MAG: hypothetical protein ACPGVU_19585 [Limisphaerales bacterium]
MTKENKWERLSRWARRERKIEGEGAPYGFSNRVAAIWAAGEAPLIPDWWEWLSIRSVVVAMVIMLGTLAVNHDVVAHGFEIDVSMMDSMEEPIL